MRLFFVVIGFKVKRYKNRGTFKFPCHCEPQARLNFRVIASIAWQSLFLLSLRALAWQSPGIKHVILSVSEISHRTIVILIIPSLRA